eukprot:5804086-Alexandrium_andersonii.AAC.1
MLWSPIQQFWSPPPKHFGAAHKHVSSSGHQNMDKGTHIRATIAGLVPSIGTRPRRDRAS